MKTMPRPVLGVMRIAVSAMLTIIRWWEDRYAEQGDHRMAALNSCLCASDRALLQIVERDFSYVLPPYVPQPPAPRRPVPMPVPRRMTLADREAREAAQDGPPRLRAAD